MDQVTCMLPFEPPKGYWDKWVRGQGCLLQGNHTSHTHQGYLAHAFDFKLRRGTQVLAARDGVVAAMCDHFREGGPRERLLPRANFVALRHNDGSYTRYLHLMPGGVLVQVGQEVSAGQPIALSGNTGFTGEPHLHFDAVNLLPQETSELRTLYPGVVSIPSVAAIFSGPLNGRSEVVAPLIYLSGDDLLESARALNSNNPMAASAVPSRSACFTVVRHMYSEYNITPAAHQPAMPSDNAGTFPVTEVVVLIDRGGAGGEQTFAEAAATAAAAVTFTGSALCMGVIVANDRAGHEVFAMAPPRQEQSAEGSGCTYGYGGEPSVAWDDPGDHFSVEGGSAFTSMTGTSCNGEDDCYATTPRRRAPFPVVMVSWESGQWLKTALSAGPGATTVVDGDDNYAYRNEQASRGPPAGNGYGWGVSAWGAPGWGGEGAWNMTTMAGSGAGGFVESDDTAGVVVVGLRAAENCPVSSSSVLTSPATAFGVRWENSGNPMEDQFMPRGSGCNAIFAPNNHDTQYYRNSGVAGGRYGEVAGSGASTAEGWERAPMLYGTHTLPVVFERGQSHYTET